MTGGEPSASAQRASLMVATPLYDGAQASYLRSVLELASLAERQGIECAFAQLSHNPSIDRVRNAMAGLFLRSACTHLLFVDGDIGFDPAQIVDLVRRMQADVELAIMGAPYPKREINWQTVAAAAAKGLASDPRELEKFSGAFAMELLDSKAGFALNAPVELAKLGAGLMIIRRDVIESLYRRHPELAYRPSRIDGLAGQVDGEIAALFHPLIETETRQLLSEDYAFCRRARDAGFRIWMAPWMRTSHTGPAKFTGAIADLAPLYATTAEPSV